MTTNLPQPQPFLRNIPRYYTANIASTKNQPTETISRPSPHHSLSKKAQAPLHQSLEWAGQKVGIKSIAVISSLERQDHLCQPSTNELFAPISVSYCQREPTSSIGCRMCEQRCQTTVTPSPGRLIFAAYDPKKEISTITYPHTILREQKCPSSSVPKTGRSYAGIQVLRSRLETQKGTNCR